MLTLRNFELQFHHTMIYRGRDYFEHGAVEGLRETDKNCWTAQVKGSEVYSTTVQLSAEQEITFTACNCPYDQGICKHVIAVLFALKKSY